MLALKQEKLFEEIDILPIDLKTKIVDKILTSITPLDSSIDALWIKEVKKRKNDIEKGKISLVDGDEVFQKISQRFYNR
ncbi:MAG: addiction module protein [Sulfurospirillum sp.]